MEDNFRKVGIPIEDYRYNEYYIDSIGNYRYFYDDDNSREVYNDYDINGNLIHQKIYDSDLNELEIEKWYSYDENNNRILYMDSNGQRITKRYDYKNRVIEETNLKFKYTRTYDYSNDSTVVTIVTKYNDNFYIGNYIKEIKYIELGYSMYFDKGHRRWAKIHRDKDSSIVLYEDSSGKYFRKTSNIDYTDKKGISISVNKCVPYMESLEIFKNKWYRTKK